VGAAQEAGHFGHRFSDTIHLIINLYKLGSPIISS
jgi:hypothetical protein